SAPPSRASAPRPARAQPSRTPSPASTPRSTPDAKSSPSATPRRPNSSPARRASSAPPPKPSHTSNTKSPPVSTPAQVFCAFRLAAVRPPGASRGHAPGFDHPTPPVCFPFHAPPIHQKTHLRRRRRIHRRGRPLRRPHPVPHAPHARPPRHPTTRRLRGPPPTRLQRVAL